MKHGANYVLLYDAIGSSALYQRLTGGNGPLADAGKIYISLKEIRKADEICAASRFETMRTELTKVCLQQLRDYLDKHSDDVVILENLDNLRSKIDEPDENIIILTNNPTQAIHYQKLGFKSERYSNDLTPYTGFRYLHLTERQITSWGTEGHIPAPTDLPPNQFAVFSNDGSSAYGAVGKRKGNKIIPLNHRDVAPYGIQARSPWQSIMIESFLSETHPISVIGARAGAGKTLLAAACALHLRATGAIRHIIYIPPVNNDPPGPGTPEEKIAPYLYGLRDNLNVIKLANHKLPQSPTSADIGVFTQDIENQVDRFERLIDKINSLDIEDVTALIDAIGDHLSAIRATLNQYDTDILADDDAKNLVTANQLLISELQRTFGALSSAQRDLTSVRQGNLRVFRRETAKSFKATAKSLREIIAPTARKAVANADIIKEFGIEVMNSTQLRSRSLAYTFLIVDEAQFLSIKEIYAIGSRASTHSHIAFLGDDKQTIDIGGSNYQPTDLNGMLLLTQTQKLSPTSHVLIVPPTVRSERLDSADFIESMERTSLSDVLESILT